MHPEICFISPDETAVQTIERCLASNIHECVVVARVSACHRVG